jgi:hypothetical protein
MVELIRRFCYECGKHTRWRIEPIDDYWELHTCEVCGVNRRYKTK